MTIFHPPSIIYEPENKAKFCIIWLHGLGANGADLVPIMESLNFSEGLAIKSIFPDAPIRPVTINGGYEMRAWYDIKTGDLKDKIDISGINESAKFVEDLIYEQVNCGIPLHKIFIAGFSQGGVIALDCALGMKKKIAGVICLSTYLAEKKGSGEGLNVFFAHGSNDSIVSLELAKKSMSQLQSLGAKVMWQVYEMDHSICREETIKLSEWIVKISRLHK